MEDGCQGEQFTSDVGEHHTEFGLNKDHESFPLSSTCCGYDLVASSEIMELFNVCPNNPHKFAYVCPEGYGLDCTMVDSVDNFPPTMVKDKPYAFNEDYLSDYDKFAHVLMSFSPLGSLEHDFHLGLSLVVVMVAYLMVPNTRYLYMWTTLLGMI